MPYRVIRLFAVLAAVGAATGSMALPEHRIVLTVIAAELAVLAFAAHLFTNNFERLVATRYLRRPQPSRRIRLGLTLSLIGLPVSALLFGLGHAHSRTLETVSAGLTVASALCAVVFTLLQLFTVFISFSTFGVALGVASLVVVLAVTSGFEREFQEKVLAVNGHLIITSYGLPEPDEARREADEMARKLKGLRGVTRIEKFSLSPGEVMIGKVGATLKGVDLSQGAPDLRRALVDGSVDNLGVPATCQAAPLLPGEDAGPAESAGRMVVGEELARKLKIKVGSCLRVLVPFPESGATTPPSYAFKVVGRFHFGFNEYDTRLAYINIEDARRLSGARQSLFGVEVRFADPVAAIGLVGEVEERLGHAYKVMDWRTLNTNLFTALTMQKVVISIILLIIIVVASFNILASLYLIVRTKKREIAILGAMGSRTRPIVGIFLVAGAMVGLAGGALGLGFGLIICKVIARFGYNLDPKVYLIEHLPIEISTVELLLVPAVAIFISLVATLYPAIKASRQNTLDGLRYD